MRQFFLILFLAGCLAVPSAKEENDDKLLNENDPSPISSVLDTVQSTASSAALCSLCNTLVPSLTAALKLGVMNDEQLANMVGNLISAAGLYTYAIAHDTALIFLPTVRYIVTNSEFVPGNVCGIFLQSHRCPFLRPDKIEWQIAPSKIPKPSIANAVPATAGSPTFKVLHISDTHWDPLYKEGSLAKCKEPTCCQERSTGVINSDADLAGYWGDYRDCDLPWRTIEDSIAQIAQRHPDVSYIIMTGDLVSHDIWATSREMNLKIMDDFLNLMKKYFPNTPIYPTLGNHEAHPGFAFAPPEITDPDMSTAWLYDDANAQWAKWLPEEVSSTVTLGGYYTTLVRPGLRIVSMNMNYCYTLNPWTLYKSQDPASQLLWLRDTLEKAEQAGEKVHIISHIPPGNYDCLSVWSREFAKIISRFEGTVAAQFYGHNHNEEFRVFYDMSTSSDLLSNLLGNGNNKRPVNVAFIGGSLTPYSNLNPSYRTYAIDGSEQNPTYAVMDWSTWITNLTAANIQGSAKSPVWFELYRASSDYSLPDLSPASMNSLLSRMLEDDGLFQSYFRNFHKAMDSVVAAGCDSACKSTILCPIATTYYADQSSCNQISKKTAQKGNNKQSLLNKTDKTPPKQTFTKKTVPKSQVKKPKQMKSANKVLRRPTTTIQGNQKNC